MANYQKLETEANDRDLKSCAPPPPAETVPLGWPAVGEPTTMQKTPWQTGILSCLGNGHEFYSSDLEVCVVGVAAPCVLHGSNAERIGVGSSSGSFASHCLPYTGLCILGNCLFGWNCLAPWFSYHNRTAIRHKFNLQGNCEVVGQTCGCCGGSAMDEVRQEQCETACDFATHVFCHACAICQEAREVRYRLPYPHSQNNIQGTPVVLMIPPAGQTMGNTRTP
ncbi:cell number regulator 8-like [Andrographis paniculata]|uniref:cell number regulator 8-like n=1 Tax=Andrographis paniculata TaxID=175694 RepID=UPI0021E9518F|nr:cell number regulator 8-like [Andrographis paniculata]XP_051114186.1 cell number regulator 8-like [Andrographis paniculata]